MLKSDNISIRNKLVLIQVFTSMLVLGIFFTVFIITDVNSYKQRIADNMISLAHVIGSNAIPTLQFDDNESAANILSELKKVSPNILHAVILDSSNNIFAVDEGTNKNAYSYPANIFSNKSMFSDTALFVADDITSENTVIGKVILEASLADMKSIISYKGKISLMLLLAAVGFSILVAIAIQSYISRRLLFLVNTMKEVSATGNYDKTIYDNGKDEISTLIKGFNSLMFQVKENQKRKDEFIGIASHELRTPVTTIKGFAEILAETETNEQEKYMVDRILISVQKLEKLIADLLDVSKIQMGQMALNVEQFDICELVKETITAVQMVSPLHEIVNESHLQKQMLYADRQRIEQVLTNLFSNAVKYSPSAKKIILYCEKTGDKIILRIRDFGVGVPVDEQQNIFEKFYRTKNFSSTISGFGLGLYICKDIIAKHKGTIWVENEDIGSSFCFSLPIGETFSEN